MRQVHFDIDRAIEKIRADMAETYAQGARLAETDEDKELVRQQDLLSELTIAFCRWDMGRCNEAVDEGVAAAALGYTLGNLIFSFSANCERGGVATINSVMECIGEAISSAMEGGSPDSVNKRTTITSEMGGRA